MGWRRGRTATYWPKVLLTIAALLSHSWLRCSTVGHRGPQALSIDLVLTPRASYLQMRLELNWKWPTSNWPSSNWLPKPSVAHGYIILWHPPASCGRTHQHRFQSHPQVKVIFWHPRPDAPASPFYCLFTQVHLLIDGSVEGQYATYTVTYQSI